jgi:Rrf2 family protein
MLSQTTEYALRAMVWLAHAGPELTPTSMLAEETRVPFNYLAKVLQALARADLIVGRRGVGGGYRLARGPAEITMLDVVNAINPVRPIETCPLGIPSHGRNLCSLHCRLDHAARELIASFGAVSLEDLLQESRADTPLCDGMRPTPMDLTLGARPVAPRVNG